MAPNHNAKIAKYGDVLRIPKTLNSAVLIETFRSQCSCCVISARVKEHSVHSVYFGNGINTRENVCFCVSYGPEGILGPPAEPNAL